MFISSSIPIPSQGIEGKAELSQETTLNEETSLFSFEETLLDLEQEISKSGQISEISEQTVSYGNLGETNEDDFNEPILANDTNNLANPLLSQSEVSETVVADNASDNEQEYNGQKELLIGKQAGDAKTGAVQKEVPFETGSNTNPLTSLQPQTIEKTVLPAHDSFDNPEKGLSAASDSIFSKSQTEIEIAEPTEKSSILENKLSSPLKEDLRTSLQEVSPLKSIQRIEIEPTNTLVQTTPKEQGETLLQKFPKHLNITQESINTSQPELKTSLPQSFKIEDRLNKSDEILSPFPKSEMAVDKVLNQAIGNEKNINPINLQEQFPSKNPSTLIQSNLSNTTEKTQEIPKNLLAALNTTSVNKTESSIHAANPEHKPPVNPQDLSLFDRNESPLAKRNESITDFSGITSKTSNQQKTPEEIQKNLSAQFPAVTSAKEKNIESLVQPLRAYSQNMNFDPTINPSGKSQDPQITNFQKLQSLTKLNKPNTIEKTSNLKTALTPSISEEVPLEMEMVSNNGQTSETSSSSTMDFQESLTIKETKTPSETLNAKKTFTETEFDLEQIMSKVNVRDNGNKELSIKLTPEHLGDLKMKIHQDGNNLAVEMIAATAEAKQVLEANLPELRAHFLNQKEGAFDQMQFTVDVEQNDFANSDQTADREQNNDDGNANSSRSEKQETQPTTSQPYQITNTDSGVNIYA